MKKYLYALYDENDNILFSGSFSEFSEFMNKDKIVLHSILNKYFKGLRNSIRYDNMKCKVYRWIDE